MGLAPRGGIAQLPQSRGPSPQGGMPNPQAQGIPTPMQGGQKKPLVEVLAMQKLEREKQAAMRDMQAKMDTDPRSIAEQLEASVMSMTQDEVKGNVKGVMDKKNMDAQKNVQRASKGLPPTRPAGLGALAGGVRPQPRPQPTQGLAAARMAQGPTKMAGGGIVAFQEGKLVKLTPTQKAAARQKFGARAERFITTLESMPQEANTAKRMLQELGPVTEPQPYVPTAATPLGRAAQTAYQDSFLVSPPEGTPVTEPLAYPYERYASPLGAVLPQTPSFEQLAKDVTKRAPSMSREEQSAAGSTLRSLGFDPLTNKAAPQREAPSLDFALGTTPQEKQLQGLPSLSQKPTSALPVNARLPNVDPVDMIGPQRPSEASRLEEPQIDATLQHFIADAEADQAGISALTLPDTDVLAGGIGSGDVKPKLDEIVNANTVDIAAADGDVSKVSGGRSKGTGTGGLGSLESYTAEARKLLGADKYQEKYAELTQRLEDLDSEAASPEELRSRQWAAFFQGAAGKTSLGSLGAGVSTSLYAEKRIQRKESRAQLIDAINLEKEALALDSSLQQAAINVGFSLMAEDRATQTAAQAAAERMEDRQIQAVLEQGKQDAAKLERADAKELEAARAAESAADRVLDERRVATLEKAEDRREREARIGVLTEQSAELSALVSAAMDERSQVATDFIESSEKLAFEEIKSALAQREELSLSGQDTTAIDNQIAKYKADYFSVGVYDEAELMAGAAYENKSYGDFGNGNEYIASLLAKLEAINALIEKERQANAGVGIKSIKKLD